MYAPFCFNVFVLSGLIFHLCSPFTHLQYCYSRFYLLSSMLFCILEHLLVTCRMQDDLWCVSRSLVAWEWDIVFLWILACFQVPYNIQHAQSQPTIATQNKIVLCHFCLLQIPQDSCSNGRVVGKITLFDLRNQVRNYHFLSQMRWYNQLAYLSR